MDEETKKALAELQEAAKAMRDSVEAEEKAYKQVESNYANFSGETKQTLEKINGRIDELEAKLQRPGNAMATPDSERKEAELQQKYMNFIRFGDQVLTEDEKKAFTTQDDPNAGYMVPKPTFKRIIELAQPYTPIRNLATVEDITKGNSFEVLREKSNLDVSATSETSTRSETKTVSNANWLEKIMIFAHEMYAQPMMTQTMIDDSGYDIEKFITSRLAKRFGVKESKWFIDGNGVDEAEGILTNSEVSRYINGHATVLAADALIKMTYDLHEMYEPNASFLMSRATIGLIRSMKDAVTGTFVWQPPYAASAPSTILGYPYYQCADMPAVDTGTYPILFGDFKEAYTIVDKKTITLLRDPYTSKPYIIIYATRRVGGKTVQPAALRKLHMATS